MKATKGNVLLRPDWDFGMPEGKIIIPDNVEAKNKARVPNCGTIVSMSGIMLSKKGVKIDPEFRPGDRVLLKEYTAEFVEWQGERLLKAPFGSVLATLENVKHPPQHV